MADPSPADLGFRMPAEWTPQAAVWLSWPLNPVTWRDRREALLSAYARFAAAISHHEPVRINCAIEHQSKARDDLRAAGANLARVEFFDIPTNDAWCRDHGPVFTRHRETGEVAVVDFTFNAWGGKFPPWDLDDAVPARVAEHLRLRRFVIPMICEGGALEVNGEGLLLTTESVLLNPNRNTGWDKARTESMLRGALGVDDILWLPSGLLGDDTDGHIDTLTRFFRPDAVLTVHDDDPSNANHATLARNTRILEAFRTRAGNRLEVVRLPNPDPIRVDNWRQEVLPPSYANFLIVNDAVIVPTYRQPAKDDAALATLARCYPGRAIVPVDCHDIVLEGGALHCLSQQQPL